MIGILAEGSDGELPAAREMPSYVGAAGQGAQRHPLTVQAADRIRTIWWTGQFEFAKTTSASAPE